MEVSSWHIYKNQLVVFLVGILYLVISRIEVIIVICSYRSNKYFSIFVLFWRIPHPLSVYDLDLFSDKISSSINNNHLYNCLYTYEVPKLLTCYTSTNLYDKFSTYISSCMLNTVVYNLVKMINFNI